MYDHNEFAVSSEPTSFGAQDHGILLILPEFFNYKKEAKLHCPDFDDTFGGELADSEATAHRARQRARDGGAEGDG